MDTSHIRQLASSASQLIATSAQLAAKQAELATLTNVTLPKLHVSIGKRIARLDKLPSDLNSYRDRVTALEAALERTDSEGKPEQRDGGQEQQAAQGFAAKAKRMAQQVADKASKATADVVATLQLQTAYASLGREAIARYGDKSVPKELRPELSAVQQQIQTLSDELAAMQSRNSVGWLTPRRLVLGGASLVALLISLFVLRAVGGVFFGSPRTPFSHKQFTQDVMNSPEYKQMVKESDAAVARMTSDLDASLGKLEEGRKDLQRDATASLNLSKLENGITTSDADWRRNTEAFDKPLTQDPSLMTLLPKDKPHLFDDVTRPQSDSLSQMFKESRGRLLKKQKVYIDQLKANTDTSEEAVAALISSYKKDCEDALIPLTRHREEAIAGIKLLISDYSSLSKTLRDSLAKEMQRWERESAAVEGEAFVDEQAVKEIHESKRERVAEYEQQLRKRLSGEVASRSKRLREQMDRIIQSIVENLSPRDARDAGKPIVEKAYAEFAEAVSARLKEVSSTRASASKDLITLIAQVKKEPTPGIAKQTPGEMQRNGNSVPFVGKKSLTDEELIEVLDVGAGISALDLSKCRQLTDKCLAAIVAANNLQALSLPEVDFSVRALAQLKGKGLRHVGVDFTRKSPVKWGLYLRMHSDQALKDKFAEVRDFNLPSDEWIEQLKGVDAAIGMIGVTLGEDVTDEGICTLVGVSPNLRTAYVEMSPHLTDKGIAAFSKCPNLKSLSLRMKGDRSGAYGGGHAEDAEWVKVTPRGIAALSPLRLEELKLPVCLQTDECLGPSLDAMQESTVTFLSFRDNRRDDVHHNWPWTKMASDAIKGRTGIKSISIRVAGTPSDDLLTNLWTLPDLAAVSVWYALTGEGFTGVERAKKLSTVGLHDGRRLTKALFSAVSKSESIEQLQIFGATSLSQDDLEGVIGNKSLSLFTIDWADGVKPTLSPAVNVRVGQALPGCTVKLTGQ